MTAALPSAAVIVAVYNGARTLPACLASLRRLDYPADRLELIVVDNASTDATPRLLAEAGAPFPDPKPLDAYNACILDTIEVD